MGLTTRPDGSEMVGPRAAALAQDAWEEIENRHALGLPFEEARQQVLDERVPGYLAEYGEAVCDRAIQYIMDVSPRMAHPGAQRASRASTWNKLVKPYLVAGGAAPSVFDRLLYNWFGRVPPAVQAFHAQRGQGDGS